LAGEHFILLSNSSPEGSFFEELYEGFYINKIKASRAINSVGSKRGKVEELLISNYNNYANRPMGFNL
jgi:DNA adenine methylase